MKGVGWLFIGFGLVLDDSKEGLGKYSLDLKAVLSIREHSIK